MCSRILTENMYQNILCSMICHETETNRKFFALDKKPQHNIKKVNQRGECHIIYHQHIKESNGLNVKQ